MVNLLDNKEAFLAVKPKFKMIVFIIISLLFLILLLTFKIKTYDNYQTKGYITCDNSCHLVVAIPSNIKFQKIKVNNKNLKYRINKKELKIDEKNLVSYFELVLDINDTYKDKEIVDINFYYNKQRIITKIKERMF